MFSSMKYQIQKLNLNVGKLERKPLEKCKQEALSLN